MEVTWKSLPPHRFYFLLHGILVHPMHSRHRQCRIGLVPVSVAAPGALGQPHEEAQEQPLHPEGPQQPRECNACESK